MIKKYLLQVVTVLALFVVLPAYPAVAGEEVPNLTLITLDGQPWKLSDYTGRVVLINFFATWCGPCRKEVPDLVKLQEELGSKGLSVIGLAIGSDPNAVVKFAKKYGINYPVAIYGRGEVEKYGAISAVPTTFLVNRKGGVAAGIEGLVPKATLEKKILELLETKDG